MSNKCVFYVIYIELFIVYMNWFWMCVYLWFHTCPHTY